MSTGRSRTHPVVRGFDRAAATYERARPDYPVAAIRHLGRVLPLGPLRTVVELGSGTGKFTRSLARLGAARIAVEPTRGMRTVFRRTVPDVPVLDGTAEAIPLPDGFADAVVSAQAFHWFRPRPALAEIRRVLRPGGGLGLVWNTRDDSVGWSRRFSEILEVYRGRTPVWRERTGPSYQRVRLSPLFQERGIGFSRIHHRAFRHYQTGSPELFVERALSVSMIAILPAAQRRRVATEVRDLLRTDPDTRGRHQIVLPYRTDVYWCHKR
ncbi:MAG: methyltransferase domain-containing protein [Thermoplasmata archaeon]